MSWTEELAKNIVDHQADEAEKRLKAASGKDQMTHTQAAQDFAQKLEDLGVPGPLASTAGGLMLGADTVGSIKDWILFILGQVAYQAFIIKAGFSAVGELAEQKAMSDAMPTILSPGQLNALNERYPGMQKVADMFKRHGFTPEMVELFNKAERPIIGAGDIAEAWRRTGNANLKNAEADMKRLGWEQEDIDKVTPLWLRLVSLSDAYEIANRGLRPEEDLTKLIAQMGYEHKWQEPLLDLRYRQLGVADFITAMRRERLDDGEVSARVQKLGFRDADKDILLSDSWSRYSSSDILHLADRGLYGTAGHDFAGSANGLNDDMLKDAKAAGWQDQYFRRLWAAHWQLPSFSTAIELVNRRIADPSILPALARASGQHPYFANMLPQLRYTLLGIRQVKNLHHLHALSDAEAIDRFELLGYTPADAALLLAEAQDEIAGSYKTLSRADIQTAYESGYMSRSDAEAALQKARYEPSAIAYYLWDSDQHRPSAEAAATAVAATGRATAAKDLTKGEIVKAYAGRGIDRDQGISLLMQIGYDQAEAAFLLDEADHQAHEARRNRAATRAEKLYIRGLIDAAEGLKDLVAAGWSATEAADLVDAWQGEAAISAAEREAARPKPSRADWMAFYKAGIVTDDELVAGLSGLGYSDEHVYLFFQMALKGQETGAGNA